jgi:hypothetical protein
MFGDRSPFEHTPKWKGKAVSSTLGGGGKLPGKTLYANRRRAMTRSSGFSVHENTTGGEFWRHSEKAYQLQQGERVDVHFLIKGHQAEDLLGFGMWFWCSNGIKRELRDAPGNSTLSGFAEDSWNKVGSMWKATNAEPVEIVFSLTANAAGNVAIYQPLCGRIRHKYLDDARNALMKNMYDFAPEAVFIDGEIEATVDIVAPGHSEDGVHELILKSCNRCGRFLPINIENERNHLSFTNHCVAAHRRPCKHSTFSSLRNEANKSDTIKLDYGYQLECRFCKKFEVNAAHNPQRSSGQMKEDGARRRAFELLLADLYKGTPQLLYRHKFHSELADDVWKNFGKCCFNCGTNLNTARDMHLDHTRPLAFLWPLDETATALCGSCNSKKRDRAPSAFYVKPGQLLQLSNITKIPLTELESPSPNESAIVTLMERLDWFFDVFLMRPEMVKEREGKITGELVVKALQRVLASSPQFHTVDLRAEYEQRRAEGCYEAEAG